MGKSTPMKYSVRRLKQVLDLNETAVSIPTLMRTFNLHGQDGKDRLGSDIQSLIDEGFAYSDKHGKYKSRAPMGDIGVVQVSEFLNRKHIAVKIRNTGPDFPFAVTMTRNQLKKIEDPNTARERQHYVVVLSRLGGAGLKARPIGKYTATKNPYIVGYFNKKGAFVAADPSIRTPLNVDIIPKKHNPHKTYSASVPFNLDPHNPKLEIGEQKWDPKTGVPVATILARKHSIITRHSKDTRMEAKEMIRRPLSLKGRRDLTHEEILVVDPPYAQDHDDGIKYDTTDYGYRTLFVAADVPHYVRPGSVQDQAAKKRGCTKYFPDKTYHMLPDRMARHASLHEGGIKPVIYVEQFWDTKGFQIKRPEIGAGFIASQKKLTYLQMEGMVHSNSSMIAPYIGLGDILIQRMRDKSLTIDMGSVDSQAVYSQSLVACSMIEAQAAIAEYLLYNNIPFLSRSHSGSDDIHNFAYMRDTLQGHGYDVPDNIGDVTTETLNDIIQQAHGDKEKSWVEGIIRSKFLYNANYTTHPHYHFGLGREHYTHAFSPIRRYPDILSLRGVHTSLNNKELGLSADDINEMARTARLMNFQQEKARLVANDRLKYYAIGDLLRLEGYVVDATLSRVNASGAEISLNKPDNLRKWLTIQSLPHAWSLASTGNALRYKGNIVPEGSPLSCRITEVRPAEADWHIDELVPASMAKHASQNVPAFTGGMS